jgi:hypothetical protein
MQNLGWGWGGEGSQWCSVCKALGSIPSTRKIMQTPRYCPRPVQLGFLGAQVQGQGPLHFRFPCLWHTLSFYLNLDELFGVLNAISKQGVSQAPSAFHQASWNLPWTHHARLGECFSFGSARRFRGNPKGGARSP